MLFLQADNIMKIGNAITSVFLAIIVTSTIHAQTFTPKYNNGINANVTGYYEYLPAGYTQPENSSKVYPVIFYFHGAGELGNVSSNNLEKLKQSGIPRIITAGKLPNTFSVNNETFSYIIICPQFISTPITPANVDAVINYIFSQPSAYRIDKSRVYLTGFSLGGKPTWEYMMSSFTNARKIAAAIPIAAYCYPIPSLSLMQNIAQAGVSVWALHNTNDLAALPSECATSYMNSLNSFNPVIPGKLTIACVPGGNAPCGHDSSSWNTIYTPALYKLPNTNLNIYQWLYTFRQSAGAVPPIANAGTDIQISLPTNSITLNGSGSYDLDGTIISYTWRSLNGPAAYTINSNSIVNPTISALVEGTYELELKISDSQGLSDLDSVRIIVTKAEDKKTGLYPNPTREGVFIKIQNQYTGAITISVSDFVGKKVSQYTINKTSEFLSHEARLNLLPAGMYFIQISMDNKIETIKVMKY